MLRDWRTEWPPERIAAVARSPGAAYLDASQPVHLLLFAEGSEPIEPRTVIEVAGYVLVESVDEPDNWYMGVRRPDGAIECWGQYGDLEETIRAL